MKRIVIVLGMACLMTGFYQCKKGDQTEKIAKKVDPNLPSSYYSINCFTSFKNKKLSKKDTRTYQNQINDFYDKFWLCAFHLQLILPYLHSCRSVLCLLVGDPQEEYGSDLCGAGALRCPLAL